MSTRKVMMVLAFAIVCGAVFAADPPKTAPAATDSSQAKPASDSATELAKKTQNPVADLITLSFQNNTYFETGPDGKTQNVLLVQPVIPMSMNEDWNFIARPIIPIINQPAMTDDQNRNGGLSNIQFEGFFSPKEKVNDWILGFGPYFEFPTNSNPDGQFGTDNWSAGPAFVALQMKGPWVYGGLVTHLWSYYGNDPQTNLTSVQPFINYNMAEGWYLSASPRLLRPIGLPTAAIPGRSPSAAVSARFSRLENSPLTLRCVSIITYSLPKPVLTGSCSFS